MQHTAHGGDGGALDGSCVPAPAGAPVGAVCAQTVALFSATRRGGTEHGAAHFFRVIAQSLQSNSPGSAKQDRAALHIGAVAFIHRFGSSLNEHVHFHVCVVDGVFEEVPGEGDADARDAATRRA